MKKWGAYKLKHPTLNTLVSIAHVLQDNIKILLENAFSIERGTNPLSVLHLKYEFTSLGCSNSIKFRESLITMSNA